MESSSFLSTLRLFTNPFSKLFFLLSFLHKNQDISFQEKHFLKGFRFFSCVFPLKFNKRSFSFPKDLYFMSSFIDLVILENEELLKSFQDFEISKDLEKFKTSLKHLLRFLKSPYFLSQKKPF